MKKIFIGCLVVFGLCFFFVKNQPTEQTAGTQIVQKEIVTFNVQTLKYHNPNCEWALRCTKNCINIEKEEAIRRGGVPCKVCGGE